MINIPDDVQDWIRNIFKQCNDEATSLLDGNPNCYEEYLDIAFVNILKRNGRATKFDNGWKVKIDTHFLGKVHMYGNFEIADIGFLVMFRSGGKIVRSKVGLLQSKRLYPDSIEPEDQNEMMWRYGEGFAGLFADDSDFALMVQEQVITFEEDDKYKALKAASEQIDAIDEYQAEHQMPIYYLFYNPGQIPLSVNVPASAQPEPVENAIGARILPSAAVHDLVKSLGTSPSYKDLKTLGAPYVGENLAGWRLETFVVDRLLQCKDGRRFYAPNDPALYNVFYRRTRPIAAALSITIDSPSDFTWDVIPDGESG